MDPTTANIALAIPNRGADAGTWDVPINGDFNSIDGFLGGVQTLSLSNANVTLTAPPGSITPSAGPYQATNAVLRFMGTLTGNVQVTLPLPGRVLIENLTSGNFTVSFAAATSGEVIATPQGSRMSIYNDGSNVRFDCGIGEIPGKMDFLGGVSALPAWVSACTVPPFLIADGSVYNFTTFPALGALYGGSFGGNGTRITTAGCGINGQTLGASGGSQNFTLQRSDLPNVAPTFTGVQGVATSINTNIPVNCSTPIGVSGPGGTTPITGTIITNLTSSFTPAGTIQSLNGGVSQTSLSNIPPTQVGGIWLINT
jgi:microcystin-dependent protein